MKLLPLSLICGAIVLSISTASAGAPDPHSNPYSDMQWVPSDTEIATITRKDWRILQAALDQYAANSKRLGLDTVTFDDVKVYLRNDSRLYRSNGKDILGNSYRFSTVAAGVKVSSVTVQELPTIPQEYWAAP